MQFRWKRFELTWLLLAAVLALLSPIEQPSTTQGAGTGGRAANQGLRPQAAVTSLAFDPLRVGRAYAGTTGRTGLWTSEDGGRSWHPEVGRVAGQPVYALLASRSHPGTLLAATARGLYEHVIGSQGWQSVPGIPAAPLYALAEDDGGGLLAAGTGPTVYRRAPDAESWASLKPLPVGVPASTESSGDSSGASGPVADKAAEAAVLALAAGLRGQIIAGTDGAGLFVSKDAGQDWDRVRDIPATYVAAVSLEPGGAGLARTRSGLFRTTDGGSSWQATAQNIDERIDALALAGPEDFLIGTSIGDIYRSHDEGVTWQRWGNGIGQPGLFFVLAAVPGQRDRWLAGRESGLYESYDSGLNWGPVPDGPGYPEARALAPGADGTLFLGDGDGVYRSTDGGQSWKPSGQSLPPATVLAIGVSQPNPQILYAALDGAGLYRSTDGGNSWLRTGWKGPGIPAILLDPRDPDHLFIRVAFERVYESRDGGKTWAARWTGLGLQTQVIALAIDPTQPGTLYAGATEGFFRSQNGGATWQQAGPELAGQTIFCLAAGTGPQIELYAGTTRGTYRSSDGGQHWERWGRQLADITVTAIAILPGQSKLAYAGTRYDGLWVTTDGGGMWQPADPDLKGRAVYSLAFSADRRWLVAATDIGVYRVPLT